MLCQRYETSQKLLIIAVDVLAAPPCQPLPDIDCAGRVQNPLDFGFDGSEARLRGCNAGALGWTHRPSTADEAARNQACGPGTRGWRLGQAGHGASAVAMYVGVLAYNPVHGDYNTVYPRSEPYDLAELARALPDNWRTARAGGGPRYRTR